MSQLNSCFDPDFDSFLDVDQNTFASSSSSPDTKSAISLRPSLASSNSSSFASSQSQQTFSGPSFRYDSYKQQTGLPVGGLANTFAVNQATGMQYTGNNEGFVMPIETLNVPLSSLDDFDFSSNSMDMGDMDFEDDSPADHLPTMFYPDDSSSKGKFVDPNSLVSQEHSPTYTAPVQRMYPGMHSQQAAQAKAQQAQKQQQMLRQQQQRQLQGQRPLPLPAQQKTQQPKDPHVEESISRLLNQMRQSSVASVDDDASTPTGNTSSLSRFKKEEDDMDEDERLLASEEGKKLSSKERRQLRNKVSARAFRSRRKEYIGQLEGEVAQKVQEANDLKVQNRQLMEENTRLTDLTRMLLSSQAFSGFLNELSANGMPAPTAAATRLQPRPQPTRKDVNPNQAARQLSNHQPQIGMAMIPETTVDFSMLETPATWNTGFQVFAITEVPEGPAIDSAILSGKTSSVTEACIVSESVKQELPTIERQPTFDPEEQLVHAPSTSVNQDIDLDESAYPLFSDSPQPIKRSHATKPVNILGGVPVEKFLHRVDLVVQEKDAEAAAWARLERMSAALDLTCERLSTFTSHLS